MKCKIIGYELKTLEVTLSPNEEFFGEVGSMVYVESGISRQLLKQNNAIKSKLSGESIFIVRFFNNSCQDKKIVLSGTLLGLHPIKVFPNNPILLSCGSYVASTKKINASLHKSKFGIKAGIAFQRIEGDATIFIETSGIPIEITLKPEEQIEIDENNLLALIGFHEHSLSSKWKMRNILHGEGLSTSFITGPGTVLLSPSIVSRSKDPVSCSIGCLAVVFIYIVIALFIAIIKIIL